jgi:hypothetical protein
MNPPPNCDKCGKPIKGPPFVFRPAGKTGAKELLHRECAVDSQISEGPNPKTLRKQAVR